MNSWIVVTFEWTLSSFSKLFTICSFWSLLKILLANHNGVFFVQNSWLGRGNFCFSAPSLGSFGASVKQIWCCEVFSIYHGLIYEACCKSGARTPGPATSGPWDPGTPSKFKSGTQEPPTKFKSGTPSSCFNQFIFFRIFLCFFTYLFLFLF